MNCSAIVMGGSMGSFKALEIILAALPTNLSVPILIAQHLYSNDEGLFAHHLSNMTLLPVTEAYDKTPIEAGHVYVAPANYHLLVEDEATLSLSIDEAVNYSRPAIDVLFESAARIWGRALAAILLSGASRDGTDGMGMVKALGGLTIAQDPASVETPFMPQSAIDAGVVDEVLTPPQIAALLRKSGCPPIKK